MTDLEAFQKAAKCRLFITISDQQEDDHFESIKMAGRFIRP
jgi:hypothetical protein